MREESYRVKLDREPSVWRREKYPLARDTPRLSKEFGLLIPTADMLEYGARVNVVKFLVGKGKIPTVGAHKPQSRIEIFKEYRIIHAACRNPILVGIPEFEIIGVAIGAVTRHSKVQQCVLWHY